jgi:hypothetical protein
MVMESSAHQFKGTRRMASTNERRTKGTIELYVVLPVGRIDCGLVGFEEGHNISMWCWSCSKSPAISALVIPSPPQMRHADSAQRSERAGASAHTLWR